MKSRSYFKFIVFAFAVLLGTVGSCFANQSAALENTVPHSKNRLFSDKNRQNQAVEVDVVVLSFEESTLNSSTLFPNYFTNSNGLLQQQAALHLSKAYLSYYIYSQTIVPGLTRRALLFPFHSFS